MRRVLALSILTVIVASSFLPSMFPDECGRGSEADWTISQDWGSDISSDLWGAVGVIPGVNTSLNVSEYPMWTRALMLPGGSVDSAVADINDDGRADLLVAVYETKQISIFYRYADGTLPSYPSYNLTLPRKPVQIEAEDMFGEGDLSIVVLERRNTVLDSDRIVIYNRTGDFLYERVVERVPYTNATGFVLGEFTGDANIDVAITCSGSSPSSSEGRLQVMVGPYFSDFLVSTAGKGANAICSGDFNVDGETDVAVANYYDKNVMVFYHPLTDAMTPDLLVQTVGFPNDIKSGLLDGDSARDLVVCTVESNTLRFYLNDGSQLPDITTNVKSLAAAPTRLAVGDVTGDAKQDVVVIHANHSMASCFVQGASPLWPAEATYKFPTGTMPRDALIGDVDGDASVEIALSSARSDWSGSSIALYCYMPGHLSNSNLTLWTDANYEASMMALGDLDGDEAQDLVLAYPELNSISYRLGITGDMHSISLGYVSDRLLVTDVNGDGDDELITSNKTDPVVDVRYAVNLLTGSFETEQLTCTANVTSIATGDFNSDGLLDIVTSTVNGSIEFFLNSGSSSMPCFASGTVLMPTPYEPIACVVAGDFDSDGDDDVAYTRSLRIIEVLLQSSESFSLPADYEMTVSTGVNFDTLWAEDVTGDGKTDLIAARPADKNLYMFDQVDFPGAAHPDLLALPEAPEFVAVRDFTDDGRADVLAVFESADLVFLYKQSESALDSVPDMVFVSGGLPVWAVFGDGTDDHRADLLVLDAASHSISIWEQNNFRPIADSGGPYVTGQGDNHVFNGSSLTQRSEIPFMEYRWVFGDGDEQDWARDPNPVHRYMELGQFTVEMWVRDPAGLTDYDSTYIDVIDSVPHVDFEWTPLNPYEGQTVVFQNLTESFDPIVTLLWYVDGELVSVGLEDSISWEFDDGLHSVTLRANDSDDSSTAKTQAFSVQALDPEIELVFPDVVDEGDVVQISVTIDPWHDGPVDAIESVEWNFSYTGGSFVVDLDTGSSNVTTHVFGAEGDAQVYVVAVRVTDEDGDWSVAYRNLEVLDIGPTADIVLSDPEPSEGVPFSFLDATYTYDGVVEWSWTLTYPDGSSDAWGLDAAAMASLEFELGNGSYEMLLEVVEDDGDENTFLLEFEVAEIPPFITLIVIPQANAYDEFEVVQFSASVDSFDEVVSFEWDFVAPGAQFETDLETEGNETSYAYRWVGNYTAKVMVTDADGSSAIQEVDLEVVDAGLEGDFGSDVIIRRDDSNRTCEITFDASMLAERYPDIFSSVWDFGDGDREVLLGPPVDPVKHAYDPSRNYEANVTFADDDGNRLELSTVLHMVEPTIELVSPADGSVVRSGTPVRFIIGDDSPPLVSVDYCVNGGEFATFESLYSIDTSDWTDGVYSIVVRAEDKDGNIAITRNVTVTIDDIDPVVSLAWQRYSVFGGDKMNISIRVNDSNLGDGSVVLMVRFPGDDSESSILMKRAGEGDYYAMVEIPRRAGALQFYVHVEDLAGNSATSETFTVQVKLRFIDAAWPYMLTAALLAAVGMAAYLFREARIAVDETFVIYRDGRMLAHSTRRLKPGMDDQVLSSMFIAVQDFVRDSFKDETSFTLRKMDFGDRSVLVEKGDHLFLAVVLHGRASKKVARRMKSVLNEIEQDFSEALVDWDGDLDKVRGVNDRVKKLYSKAPILPGLPKLRNT